MRSYYFSSFMLFILTGVMLVYFYFKHHFSGVEYYQQKSARLSQDIHREKLNAVLANYQLREMQQEVARLMPQQKGAARPEDSYPLRNLASIVSLPNADAFRFERASSLFEKGRNQFRKAAFSDSNKTFQNLISYFPDSVHVVRAYFLLAEGQYQSGDFDQCVDTIDAMVSKFPEDELTGFSLLRLGRIYHRQDRLEDAAEVYEVISKSYVNSDLQNQAMVQKRDLE